MRKSQIYIDKLCDKYYTLIIKLINFYYYQFIKRRSVWNES